MQRVQPEPSSGWEQIRGNEANPPLHLPPWEKRLVHEDGPGQVWGLPGGRLLPDQWQGWRCTGSLLKRSGSEFMITFRDLDLSFRSSWTGIIMPLKNIKLSDLLQFWIGTTSAPLPSLTLCSCTTGTWSCTWSCQIRGSGGPAKDMSCSSRRVPRPTHMTMTGSVLARSAIFFGWSSMWTVFNLNLFFYKRSF